MQLCEAFRVERGEIVAFIGAGGKTSTLVALGYELAARGWRVLATTTTRLGADQLTLMPAARQASDGAAALALALDEHRFVFVYTDIRGDKAHGVTPAQFTDLLAETNADVILIEADGARGLPLKAPRAHEPVIPAETTLVVSIASLSVLGKPLNTDYVFNADAIIEQSGIAQNSPLKSAHLARILSDDRLGLQGVPETARVMIFLNDAPAQGYGRARGQFIASLLLDSARINGVAIGSSRQPVVHEVRRRVGAVVLAAGLARRMGQPKVLLPWARGQTIIEHILDQLREARIHDITVVTGHHADAVRQLAERKGAAVIFNADYAAGDMLSSLKTGLRALAADTSAALVVLGDQPGIEPKIVRQILAAYAEGQGQIVAPSYQMRRGHPILIDRCYWQELLALPNDGAPRDVINAHPEAAAYINVETDSVLRDVDTPEAYQQERRRAGLADT